MNSVYYEDLYDAFETNELRDYARDMVNLSPAYLAVIPASSSGKYHSEQQCGEGGQVIHVKLACMIMNYILGLEYVQKRTTPHKRDILRTAILLHDSFKSGAFNTGHTIHEHPLLAANWVEKMKPRHDISQRDKKHIAKLIITHSGQWRLSDKSDYMLPKLRTKEQFLVHMCDYLASRKEFWLEM